MKVKFRFALCVVACLHTFVCICFVSLAIAGVPTDKPSLDEGSLNKNTSNKDVFKTQLPAETNLLFRPRIKNFIFADDIYAYVHNKKIYYSLIDVIDVFDLPIRYDADLKKGSGWFLREDWKVSIDLDNHKVISKGVKYDVSDVDYVVFEDESYISAPAIKDWLSLELTPDVEQQYVEINSAYPLPIYAKYLRQNKSSNFIRQSNIPVLPRHPIEYDWLDLNTANVRVSAQSRRNSSNEAFQTSGRMTTTVEGQVLKHGAYFLSSVDNTNKINTVSARLSKRDEAGQLLGPLGAYEYNLGDVNITDLALTGDAGQELGFRLSNAAFDTAQLQVTDINGNAIPGWDVELYQNGILSASMTVDDSGFYEFSDVQLFGGDNLFELFFYGPQGEVRNKEVSIPITAKRLSSKKGSYDISVSLSDTKTYVKDNITDPDRGTPHLVARYDKSIGNTLTYSGLRYRQIEGEDKLFLGAGFSHLFKRALIDGNFSIDNKTNKAGQIALRKSHKDWNWLLSGFAQDKDFQSTKSSNPVTLSLNSSLQKSFATYKKSRANLSASAEYSRIKDSSQIYTGRLGASLQKNRYNLGNTVFFQKDISSAGQELTRLNNTLSFRGSFQNAFLRTGLTYNIEPDWAVETLFAQANYYHDNNLSAEALLERQPQRDFHRLRFGLNYTNKYFRTSPFLEMNSDDNVLAGLNVSFNLVDVPESNLPQLTSKQSTGRGLVSSFVYFDKDGNYTYDNDDEILPNVSVESVNVKRRAQTNEKGYSLIHNLPVQRATDVQVDQYSLPDPYMVAASKGVSIFPSAGEIVDLDFPVHLSGEVDGSISVRDKKGNLKPLRRAEVILYPVNRSQDYVLKSKAAIDGFYVASQIVHGRYLMTVSNETAKNAKASLPLPRFIDVGYDGEVFYGYDFELDQSKINTPIDVIYDQNLTESIQYALRVQRVAKTKLLQLVSSLKASQGQGADVFSGLTAIKENGSEVVYSLAKQDLKLAYNKCEQLVMQAYPCRLQVYMPTKSKPFQNVVKTAQASQKTSLR